MRKLNYLLMTISLFLFSFSINGQTGYTDDFEGTLAAGWAPNPNQKLEQSGGLLNLDVTSRNRWQNLYLALPSTIDVSANPYVNIKVKTDDQPFVFYVYLQDTDNDVVILNQKVNQTAEFIEYNFDFTGLFTANDVDSTSIKSMIFGFNGNTVGFSSEFQFDDLLVGSDATNKASLGGIMNQEAFMNETGKSFLVTGIANADDISVTGGGSLIENVVVSAITDGIATVTYDCQNGASGTDQLSITANGSTGYADNSITIDLTVEDNNAPLIDQAGDIDAAVGVIKTIMLKGIADGNVAQEQTMDITAVSDNQSAIPNGNISATYDGTSRSATLEIDPAAAATDVTITVTVDDNEAANNTTDMTFLVDVYATFNNAPTIDDIQGRTMYTDEPGQSIALTGIGDGDGAGQNLSFTVTSSVDSVIPNSSLVLSYTQGNPTGLLSYGQGKIGKSVITITIEDDGGEAGNNGDNSISKSFSVEVAEVPPTGMIFDFVDYQSDTANGKITIEGEGGSQFPTYIDSGSYNCLKLDVTNKGIWNGTWLQGFVLDISENPYLSMEVWVEDEMEFWMWFWDNDTAYTGGNRGKRHNYDLKSGEHAVKVTQTGQWVPVVFDFYPAGELVDGSGVPLLNQNIVEILLNWHPERQTGPNQPPPYSGTCYFRNIRAGSEAEGIAPKTPVVTINGVGDQAIFPDAGEQQVMISNVTDGNDGSVTPVVTASSDNVSLVPDPVVTAVNEKGIATLTYTPNSGTGSATITLTATAAGSVQNSTTFTIDIIDDAPASATTINVDQGTTYQTLLGFGSDISKEGSVKQHVNDLGGTLARIFPTGSNFEPVNDNSDPMVLSYENLKQNGRDYEFLKYAYESGIETWFMTLLSAPAWMKQNLSENYGYASAITWEATNNKVEPYYYDEYAEHIVAIIKLLKEKTGIELYAVCPQNEPAFCEPYPSGILSPEKFAEFCAVLGARFEAEGISTKIINSEQVFTQGFYSITQYIDAVQANPDADKYTDYIGIHYPNADQTRWEDYYNNCQETANKKEIWPGECKSSGDEFNEAYGTTKGMAYGLKYGKIPMWTAFGYNQGPTSSEGCIQGSTPVKQYYCYKNFYRYIRPGAEHVESNTSDGDLTVVAFKNTAEYGEHLAIVIMNDNSTPKSIELNVTNGDMPTYYRVFRTSENENCILLDSVGSGDLISLAGNSITTLQGVRAEQPLTVVNGTPSGDYPVDGQVNIVADDPATAFEVFYRWTGTDVEQYVLDVYNPNTMITMPNTAYTVTASYRTLPSYTLTVNDGTGDGDYLEGQIVTIEADPAPGGQEFDKWTGDVQFIPNVNEPTVDITIPDQDVTLTATYRTIATKYTLTITDGEIDGTGGATTKDYAEGTVVPISGDMPATGYKFSQWTGDVANVDNVLNRQTSITMPASNVDLTATYELITFNLTVENGSGSGDYTVDEQVQIVADAPQAGDEFTHWSGAVSHLDDEYNDTAMVTMPNDDIVITANYQIMTFAMSFVVTDGTNPVSGATVTVGTNADQTDANGEISYLVDYGNRGFQITANGYQTFTGLVMLDSDTTLNVTLTPQTGIDESNAIVSDDITIYPNPVTSILHVAINNNIYNTLIISDITGKTYANRKLMTGEKQVDLDVANLSPGVYMISLYGQDKSFRTAFIVK